MPNKKISEFTEDTSLNLDDWIPSQSNDGTTDKKLKVSTLVSGVWAAYTPTWTTTGAGADPAIGNGSLTGRYTQIGKTVHFFAKMVAGSTTTFGSGEWELGLPVARYTGYAIADAIFINGYAENSGVQGYIIAAGRGGNSLDSVVLRNGTAGPYASTLPFTWGTGDFLSIAGTYEAA